VEARLIERAKLDKVTKSKLVNDLLEQALAPPGPYELLQRIRRLSPGESIGGSEDMSKKLKTKLRRKYSRAKRPN
jgi:hypothetical protein